MISLQSQLCLKYFISVYDKVILSERSEWFFLGRDFAIDPAVIIYPCSF